MIQFLKGTWRLVTASGELVTTPHPDLYGLAINVHNSSIPMLALDSKKKIAAVDKAFPNSRHSDRTLTLGMVLMVYAHGMQHYKPHMRVEKAKGGGRELVMQSGLTRMLEHDITRDTLTKDKLEVIAHLSEDEEAEQILLSDMLLYVSTRHLVPLKKYANRHGHSRLAKACDLCIEQGGKF